MIIQKNNRDINTTNSSSHRMDFILEIIKERSFTTSIDELLTD